MCQGLRGFLFNSGKKEASSRVLPDSPPTPSRKQQSSAEAVPRDTEAAGDRQGPPSLQATGPESSVEVTAIERGRQKQVNSVHGTAAGLCEPPEEKRVPLWPPSGLPHSAAAGS